jgi:hypothetical protein
MSHANAALTPRHRLRLARLIVEEGWATSRAAEFFHVSWRTADRWAQQCGNREASAHVQRRSTVVQWPHHPTISNGPANRSASDGCVETTT